jgi:hypothetical protein
VRFVVKCGAMPAPEFKEALKKFAAKVIVTGDLTSADWLADVPAALRDRALFSARVTNAQLLQGLRSGVESLLQATTDPATARLEMQRLLQSIGYQPDAKDRGTIKDLSSDARINLQLGHNSQSAQGYGQWSQGQDPGAVDAFPAQELFRLESREEPRDWPTRWNAARGELGNATSAADGRVAMVALKSDPIWERISAFGVPWPPFDFNSRMWVRDVGRREAEELGVIQPGQRAVSGVERFNRDLQASGRDLDGATLASLKASFGDQIRIEGDAVVWQGQ